MGRNGFLLPLSSLLIFGWLVRVSVPTCGVGGGKLLFVLSGAGIINYGDCPDCHSQIRLRQEYYYRERQYNCRILRILKGFSSIMTHPVVCLSVVILSIPSPLRDKCTFVTALTMLKHFSMPLVLNPMAVTKCTQYNNNNTRY